MTSPASPQLSVSRASEVDEKITEVNLNAAPVSKKGLKLWLVFGTMCVCLFLTALEVSSVSTALPTIANALHAEQFTWVGSAYALASTAFLPMSGGLAQTFGRRPSMLLTLGLFALGSGICGGAKSMNMLIAGRTIQGLGGGGIQSITSIVLADLVTLKERGVYAGFYSLMWCLAASFAPVIGGTLAAGGQWRWLFYLNLPISFVAAVLVVLFMDLPVPPGSYREKFMRMDWVGNFLVVASTAAYTIGLTWGGITFPWSSAAVLVPLVLGLVGLVVFIAYETVFAKHPLVPLITSLTSISGYVQMFCCSVASSTVYYYYPVYFQACKGASPIQSGVYSLSLATVSITAIVTGLLVKTTKRYRPYMRTGWVIGIIALSLMSTLRATDPLGKSIGYACLLGFGIGMLQSTPMFPIQAPLPVTQNAPALAFMWFTRLFGVVWGITIGSTVLQNELARELPTSFLSFVPEGTAIAYALIPELSTLPLQMRTEVQAAFAGSLAVVWRVLAAVCGAGLLASFLMKGLALHDALDEDWGLKKDSEKVDPSESM